jgi:PAS domain S-box-containing protein
MQQDQKKSSFVQKSRNIILIFFSLASLMIVSALFELHQSKNELLQLMKEQAHSLLESLIIASQNSLLTNQYLEEVSQKRLLNNARFVKGLYEENRLNSKILEYICRQNDLRRINLYNRKGEKILSSHQPTHFDIPEKHSPVDILKPIFSGRADSLIIGLKPARYESGYRYAVAVATHNRGAIVVNIDAKEILTFKREIGFGSLLRNVVIDNPRIIYAALQDSMNILAASGNVRVLEAISTSEFLNKSLDDSLFMTRTVSFDMIEVFEAVHPFSIRNETIGLLRVGLSMDPIQDINERIYRRLVIITIILVVIGSFMISFLFTRQRFSLLQRQYEVVETFSGNIISHVSDAIIVFNDSDGIKIFNSAAEKLFGISRSKISGLSFEQLFEYADYKKIIAETSNLQQLDCMINTQKKYLLLSKNVFTDSDEKRNTIMVIRDLTEQKKVEEQLEREKRLTAMGELASGVAHEIRNPLNAIGTIIQQLNKDFTPIEDEREYKDLTAIVLNEVKRINATIQDFLRFARPEPVQPEKFQVAAMLDQLIKQYHYLAEERQIELKTQIEWEGEVYWDNRQIRQVLINLIQNAIEAIDNNGHIIVSLKKKNNGEIEICIMDNGPGMPKNVLSKIFNLYFTTKAHGTGIGLSLVQRIIFEHGGSIDIESEPAQGSSFVIRLPISVQK